MEKREHVPAIAVYTGKSVKRILEEGGSGDWVVDLKKADKYKYVVCTRSGIEWAEGEEPKGSGFLVGRVSQIVPVPGYPKTRYLFRFSEYATLNDPDVWKGWRYPVKYTTMKDLGIEFSRLRWKPVPGQNSPVSSGQSGRNVEARNGLTIAEAKRGLALSLGVSEEAVEITIRG